MTVGSRTIQLVVDTGSSDTIILTDKFHSCHRARGYCVKFGTIASWNRLNPSQRFTTTFGSSRTAAGEIVSTTFTFSSHTIENVQFGVPDSLPSLDHNVLGLGYPAKETVEGSQYPNFPQAIKNQGLIKTAAYSLWLNSASAQAGSILFGGIDKSKFIGKLTTFKVRATNSQYLDFLLSIKGVSFAGKHIPGSCSAVLDSGYTGSSFPFSLASGIWAAAGIRADQIDQNTGFPVVDCDFGNSFSVPFLEYNFGSAKLRVPVSELLVRGAPGQCWLGIAATKADENMPLLGLTFLRSIYAVFDLYNNEISLAQANFHPGSSRIVELATDGIRALKLAEEEDGETLDASNTDSTNEPALTAGLESSDIANVENPDISTFDEGGSSLSPQASGDNLLFQGSTDATPFNQNPSTTLQERPIGSDIAGTNSQGTVSLASAFSPNSNTEEIGQANIGLPSGGPTLGSTDSKTNLGSVPASKAEGSEQANLGLFSFSKPESVAQVGNENPDGQSVTLASTLYLTQDKTNEDITRAGESNGFNPQNLQAFKAPTFQVPGEAAVASNSESTSPGSITGKGDWRIGSEGLAFNSDEASILSLEA